MAVTVTVKKVFRGVGDHTAVLATVADSAYPTNGTDLTTPAVLQALGLNDLDAVQPQAVSSVGGTRLFEWVQSTGKLKSYTAVGTEVVNTTDESAKPATILAFGSGISDA